jgi:hypothetical protein
METTTAVKKGPSNKNIIIVAAVIVLVVVIAAAAVVVTVLGNKDDDSVIGYSTDAQVLVTQEDIDKAMEEALANADNGDIALSYKNDAFSTDGTNFECYIINSEYNTYDMYLTIYADAQLTDELFLSQLVPPGSGFENITLEHPLEDGDHTVYVGLTQVAKDEETGVESIVNQVIYTMVFHVGEEWG